MDREKMQTKKVKIFTAILHTKNIKYDDEIQNDKATKTLWRKICEFMDGEMALVASSAFQDNTYILLCLQDDKKDKELWWMIEQDDMIGVYSDREDFDKVWDAGKYELDGSMHLEPEYVEVVKNEYSIKVSRC